MKIRTLPLLLSSALATAVIAPAALAAITLNGQAITSFSVTNVGADVVITTTGAFVDPNPGPDPDPDPAPDPTPDPTPDPDPDPGICGAESQEQVFETLNWAQQPGQTVIAIPRAGSISSRFTTTPSITNTGLVAMVPTTGTGYVTRNMWISTCPGGAPVAQTYNGCLSSGTEASIGWSQAASDRGRRTCLLQPSTVYYLNYSNEGCNASACGAFRNTYN